MNALLIFFAFPVATIILSIAVEKIIRCSILTAGIFFSAYLILSFSVFDETFLVYTIVYTIISFITAIISRYFFTRYMEERRRQQNTSEQETLLVNTRNLQNGSRTSWNCCRR